MPSRPPIVSPEKIVPLSLNERKELARRQTAELFRLMPAATGFSYVGAILTFLMLVSTGDAHHGVYWFAYSSVVMLFRTLVYFEYRNHSNGRGNSPEGWKWLAIVMNLLAGIQWGLLGTVLFASDPVHRAVFQTIMVVGYVGGSIIVYSPVRFAHTALAVPAILPPAVNIFFLGTTPNLIGGAASLFMLVAVIVVAEMQYRIIRRRLLLELEIDSRLRAAQAQNTTLGENLKRLEHKTEVIKRSQVEARRRADTLSNHVQNTLLPVFECDAQGRVVEWNDAATEAFGYTLKDLTDVTLDQIVTPLGSRQWVNVFGAALERKTAAALEVEVRSADGRDVSATFYVTPIDIDGTRSSRAAIIAIPKVGNQAHSKPRLTSVG